MFSHFAGRDVGFGYAKLLVRPTVGALKAGRLPVWGFLCCELPTGVGSRRRRRAEVLGPGCLARARGARSARHFRPEVVPPLGRAASDRMLAPPAVFLGPCPTHPRGGVSEEVCTAGAAQGGMARQVRRAISHTQLGRVYTPVAWEDGGPQARGWGESRTPAPRRDARSGGEFRW